MGKASTRVRHFHVYGGPAAGSLARVRKGETRHSDRDRRHRGGPSYWYALVSAAGGGSAFVPEDDECLRQAFLSTSGEPGSRETETLAAEIQRRALKV
jgi:hypothetical protein